MSLAIVYSRSLSGLAAPEVTVEVHLANGLPCFTLVGLAETEVKEARERVRAAISNSGLDFPHNKRITVNLAPADLPKESGRFDLPIALGILAAAETIDGAALSSWEFAGELSLSGQLRAVRGALAMALALKREGAPRRLLLPKDSAQEAALVRDLALFQAEHLLDVVHAFRATAAQGAEPAPSRLKAAQTSAPELVPKPLLSDIRDVKGQAGAKRALEIAAAGGHSLLMIGPPGTGKSMLAQRFCSLLPPLNEDQALESAALLSLVGDFQVQGWTQRVYRSPHHTASAVALVGGGSPPRPGEISLAHHGVLFLDELAEFPRATLEALREPLENGHITISRAAQRAQFPARFQLIAAMNPCPCGYAGSTLRHCRCSPEQIARYQARLSGPLLDRIDVQVDVPVMSPEVLSQAPNGEPTALVAQRVQQAHAVQWQRQACANAELPSAALELHARMQDRASEFLKAAAIQLAWSGRSYHRVMRLARTIADLGHSDTIQTVHVAEAIQYRRSLIRA